MQIDKTLYRTIESMEEGREKEAALKAWNKYPTFRTDCKLDRHRKEALRKEYINRLLGN